MTLCGLSRARVFPVIIHYFITNFLASVLCKHAWIMVNFIYIYFHSLDFEQPRPPRTISTSREYSPPFRPSCES